MSKIFKLSSVCLLSLLVACGSQVVEFPDQSTSDNQDTKPSGEKDAGTTPSDPDTSSDKPDTSSDKPDTSSDKPDTSSDKPDTSVLNPDVSTDKPDVNVGDVSGDGTGVCNHDKCHGACNHAKLVCESKCNWLCDDSASLCKSKCDQDQRCEEDRKSCKERCDCDADKCNAVKTKCMVTCVSNYNECYDKCDHCSCE